MIKSNNYKLTKCLSKDKDVEKIFLKVCLYTFHKKYNKLKDMKLNDTHFHSYYSALFRRS